MQYGGGHGEDRGGGSGGASDAQSVASWRNRSRPGGSSRAGGCGWGKSLDTINEDMDGF